MILVTAKVATEEVTTVTLKVISATTKVILTANTPMTATKKVVSVTTKVILTADYNLITTILTAGAEYIGIFTQLSPHSVLPFNPLTAGAIHIRFLHFLSAQYISAFKDVKDKKWH